MAYDLFKGQTGTSFARGSAPPPGSYEWVGVAMPPAKAPAAVEVRGEKKKSRVWPWIFGFGVGLGVGCMWRKD